MRMKTKKRKTGGAENQRMVAGSPGQIRLSRHRIRLVLFTEMAREAVIKLTFHQQNEMPLTSWQIPITLKFFIKGDPAANRFFPVSAFTL